MDLYIFLLVQLKVNIFFSFLLKLQNPIMSESDNYEKQKQQALKVISTMLIDRGYTIFEDKDDFCSLKAEKDSKKILCFIIDDDKLNIQGIKDIINILNKNNATKSIIVHNNGITPSAKKSLETTNYSIELFSLKEMQINITHHRLVPKHLKASAEEKNILEKNYKGKLPLILSTDPVVRYYAFNKGDYIKIVRKDGSIFFRVVK